MISRILLIGIVLSILFASCNSETENQDKTEKKTYSETSVSFKLGDSTVTFKTYFAGKESIIYFNMHDDENTAVEAAKQVLDKTDARLIEIQASGDRLISFNLDTVVYRFDPNRIYTSLGRMKTLKKYSTYSPEADSVVEQFANYITGNLLKNTSLIVTLHNNSPDNYSILSYAQSGEYETDAAEVFVNKNQDPDDFFYVTEKKFFDKISQKGFNVLLQDNSKVTDDGSLSVYCGKNGIEYINVEAEKGHLVQQKEMILALQELIR